MAQSDAQFMEVRAANQADVGDLRRMRLALQAHLARANPHLVALSAQRVAALTTFYCDLLANPQAQVLVVHGPQGTPRIGMAVGRIVRHEEFAPPLWGHIEDVWVRPAYRHRGLCRTLMTQLLEFFEGAGVEVLVLDYVIGNTAAEGAWKQLGFQPVLTVANAKLHEVRKQLWREPT